MNWIIRKELAIFFTDRAGAFLTLIVPTLLAALVGMLFAAPDGPSLDLLVVDQDGSANSAFLVEQLRGTGMQIEQVDMEVARARVSAGERLAIIGENGVGKTTLLRCLLNELEPDKGSIQWAENAAIGFCPQDNTRDFDNDLTLFDWMSQWRKASHNDQIVRATLGQLLFSSDDFLKPVKVCSGGEKNRLLFGKLMMSSPNVLVLDEPTNHMDMEAIEALNLALVHYEGTIIFVSHDREFVSSLATQIVEIKDKKLINFAGTYDEYLANQKPERKVANF